MEQQLRNSERSQFLERSLLLSKNNSSKGWGSNYLRNNSQQMLQPINEKLNVSVILKKPIPSRSAEDRKVIANFIENNDFFVEASHRVGIEFVKNLLNQGEFIDIVKGSTLFHQGSKIRSVGVLLQGNLGIIQKEQELVKEDKESGLWENLIKQINNISKTLYSNYFLQKTDSVNEFPHSQNYESLCQKFTSFINTQESFGYEDIIKGLEYKRTCIVVEDAKIFQISIEKMLKLLNNSIKLKLKNLYSKIAGLPYFSFLEQKQINQIIQAMVLRKINKGKQVFREKQISDKIYFLEEGDIKIIKATELLRDDPNELYMNRKKLVEEEMTKAMSVNTRHQRLLINKIVNKSNLPYADLETMYNFIPSTKNIEIGTLTGFCIFGEEQILSGKKRQTTAICSTLTAQYYQLEIKKLIEIIGAKNESVFLSEVRNYIRNKILSRQKTFSRTLYIENRSHMDYFFIEGEEGKKSSRKLTIDKFNNKIMERENLKKLSKTLTPKSQEKVPPAFNSFNFQKLIQHKRSISENKRSSVPKYEQNHTQDQIRIMEGTHTWKLIKQKVQQQRKTFLKMKGKKQKMYNSVIKQNISSSLIRQQIFINVLKVEKKIRYFGEKKNDIPYLSITKSDYIVIENIYIVDKLKK